MTVPRRIRAAHPPVRYEIVVRGELSRRYRATFEGMTLTAGNGQTAITGPVVDQTQLQGLLDRVGELGLELVSVRVATPPPGRADVDHGEAGRHGQEE